MKIEYPTIDKETDLSEVEKQTKVAKYFGHNNSLGFYPVGRLNTWHGGVHIEGEKEEIKVIADGRIIAYRMAENYYPRNNDKDEIPYSNSFVLMQHNYTSPKEQKLRFYSLYMHLMPKKLLEEKKIVPDIFARYAGKVKGDEVESGINARSGSETEPARDAKKIGVKKLLIPVGETVTLDPLPTQPAFLGFTNNISSFTNPYINPIEAQYQREMEVQRLQAVIDNHWSSIEERKALGYKRVRYKNYTDIYIATADGSVKDLGDGKLMITTVEDSILYYNPSAIKGAVVYNKPDNNGGAKYLRTEPKGTELGELEKVSDTWFKIKGKEEYVFKDALDISKTVKESVTLDSVQNVDIEIKSGSTIGYSGTYGIKNRKNYSAVHLEVFTDDTAINDFIANKMGDDNRNQYEVPENSPLQIGKPINNLKKNTKVKVYEYKGDYVQIGFEDVELLIDYTNLVDNNSYYNIKDEALSLVNSKSNYKFTKTDQLTPQKKRFRDKDDNVVSQTNATHRKLILKKDRSGQKFWVKANVVPSANVLQPLQPLQGVGVTGVKASSQGTATSANGDFEPCWAKLTADVDVVYETEPNSDNTSDIIINDIIQVQRKLAIATDNNGNKWVKIKGLYFEDSIKKTTEGWIKESELTVINPYNWQEFNWQLNEDTGNLYFYGFDTKEGEEPHEFINSIWNLVDLNQDKVLTQRELQLVMRNEQKVNILSKLICKHQSEWDTWQNIDAFKQEVEALYKKGIDAEEVAEEKQKLEEARNERVSFLEEKIQNLCFWHNVKDGDIGTPKEGAEQRTFPSDSNVYHFHPIAFVEQMKRVLSGVPPWMEVALEEAKAARFVKEYYSKEPTKANIGHMVKKYHNYCGYFDNVGTTKYVEDERDSWCSSFVSWCLGQTNYKGAKSTASQNVLWKEGEFYKRIEEPEFGCIALFTNYVKSSGRQTANGHIAFLYGLDDKGNLICLGGNQADTIKFSRYYLNKVCSTFEQYQKIEGTEVVVEQKFQGFFLPINYPEGNGKRLEVIDITKLNNQLAGETVKSDAENEKTT